MKKVIIPDFNLGDSINICDVDLNTCIMLAYYENNPRYLIYVNDDQLYGYLDNSNINNAYDDDNFESLIDVVRHLLRYEPDLTFKIF